MRRHRGRLDREPAGEAERLLWRPSRPKSSRIAVFCGASRPLEAEKIETQRRRRGRFEEQRTIAYQVHQQLAASPSGLIKPPLLDPNGTWSQPRRGLGRGNSEDDQDLEQGSKRASRARARVMKKVVPLPGSGGHWPSTGHPTDSRGQLLTVETAIARIQGGRVTRLVKPPPLALNGTWSRPRRGLGPVYSDGAAELEPKPPRWRSVRPRSQRLAQFGRFSSP